MNQIPPNTFSEIQQKLKEVEKEHDVEVLLAIESWSRAWGFESKDSDFDIRFIYAHKIDYYLSIWKNRDVIDYPIVDLIDINGWDLKKALQLFQKGNPSFSEWIKSPIIYSQKSEFREKVLQIEDTYFSPISHIFHYLSMGWRNYREYLKQEPVKIKKYFYVLRPILACLWIDKNGTPPPMEFQKLYEDCELISPELRNEIDELLKKKRSWVEMGKGNKIPILNDFLEEQITYIQNKAKKYNNNQIPTDILDTVFRKYIPSDEKHTQNTWQTPNNR